MMTRPSLIRLAAATGMACLFTLPIWAVAAPLAGRPADATDRRAAASPPRAAQLPQPDAGNAEVTILGAIAPATLDVDLRDLPIAAPAADTRPEREAPAPAEPRGPALSMAEMPSATDAAAVQR